MSFLIRILTVCLANLFLIQYLKYKQTMSLSEYTRQYPNVGLCGLVDIIRIGEIEKSIPRITDWHYEACEGQFFLSHPHMKNGLCLVTHFI